MDTTLYLTIPEAAHLLRIAPQTIRNHIFKGDFPIPTTLLCGRRLIRRSDVEAFVQGDPLNAQQQSTAIPSFSKRGRRPKQPPKQNGGKS
ncbi:MAG: helix-turn-helix domain-containing protein [Sideroxydans sp.]|nr:helix-turn-helix domain-containing protein [Sideroxydans sp.]